MALTMDELVDDLKKAWFVYAHGEKNGHYGYGRLMEREESDVSLYEEISHIAKTGTVMDKRKRS